LSTNKIGVIGLGYVGLPLAMAFAEKYKVVGFDINENRIVELCEGRDHTLEVNVANMKQLQQMYLKERATCGIYFSDDFHKLRDCNIYIIAVPTPVDTYNVPDLTLLKEASKIVSGLLKKKDVVIYESTVYPGCTEEIGVPVLEEYSGLTFNIDFYCGYSPERINPGDKSRTISEIRKITSGSTTATARLVDELYASIITAGTYLAPSIKVAEAAKVIENTQRDVNIAFVNELSKIFNLLGIDTQEVLKAAATKWNFLPFKPGLVGGHCIGIDPYYLSHKAAAVGYQAEIILAARKMNDSMGEYVALRVVQLMAKKGIFEAGKEILVMGITFKENFSDVRNSRVVDMINALRTYHLKVTVYDPLASPESVKAFYRLDSLVALEKNKKFSAVIVAVSHSEFSSMDYASILHKPGVLFDVKGTLENELVDGKL
jgi:UDP-N-acetyl-D-galactosamine dehydrogenase